MNSVKKTNIFITFLLMSSCIFAEDLNNKNNNPNVTPENQVPEKTSESSSLKSYFQDIFQPQKPVSTNNKQTEIVNTSRPEKQKSNIKPEIVKSEKNIRQEKTQITPIKKTPTKKPVSAKNKQNEIVEIAIPGKQKSIAKPKVIESEKYIEHKQIQIAPIKETPIKTEYSDNKEKGLAIITEVDRRDTGWKDSQAKLKMILKNRQGDEHSRSLKMKTMEVQGDGDKSLSIFGSPKDIKGTAFLSYTHALDPDEQWLYLPAVKRVKRISSRNKSGPYLGSEFAFEDLASFEIKKYRYEFIKDEVLEGIDCFVIEAYPEYKYSGYTRTMLWIDKKRYVLLKTDYYDRKNSLLKTQTFKGYNQYLGQYWRPDEMEMVNHTNGKSTKLIWANYKFRKGLTKRSFDKNTLKRAR